MTASQLPAPMAIVVTCEHGGNELPEEYRAHFADAAEILQTHRGYDLGALNLAQTIRQQLAVPLFFSTTTRLLVDLNRSLDNRQVFSDWTRRLSRRDQQQIVQTIYHPYRNQVSQHIASLAREHFVLHFSVHTFTPIWKEKRRRTDIGLLFNPLRRYERQICNACRIECQRVLPHLKVHFNLPYRGTSDGFTTTLRQQFADEQYAGIELEVNQKLLHKDSERAILADRLNLILQQACLQICK